MDTIALNPVPNQQDLTPKIDLGSTQGYTVPSNASATNTAAKASFGLGGIMNRPYDDFYSTIANGQEFAMRQEASTTVDAANAKRKLNLVSQVAAMAPNASSLAKDRLTMASLTGTQPPTDPKSVVEEYYSGKYLEPMWNFQDKYPGIGDDVRKAPQEFNDAVNAGITNLAYKNYAISRLQKSLDTYKNQPILGTGSSFIEDPSMTVGAMPTENPLSGKVGDYLKEISQIYSEIKLRGWSGDWSSLLGTSLDKERQNAYNMPFNDFKTWFDQRMDQLDKDNPSLALTFGSAIVGQSTYEIQNNDATTLVGVPSDVSVIGGVVDTAALSARKIKAAVQDTVKSTELVDKLSTKLGDLDKRTETVTVTPQDIKTAQAVGHGDLGEAAVQTTAQDLTAKFENKENPVQQAVQSMPSLFKEDIDGVTHNTGNLGQEVANRIREQYEARAIDVQKGVTDLMKVNRTPVIVASEDLARALKQWARGKYSGANSTILDVGNQLLYDQPSNTYHLSLSIGDHNGEYFANEGQAVSHAELYGIELDSPSTTTRRYWDDEATAAAFEVEHLKGEISKFDNKYTSQQFKPKKYYDLKKQLAQQNQRKKNAWSQRAGAYWKPDQPIEAKLGKTTLEKQGLGWYIQGWVPVDETQSVIRDNLLKIPGAWSGPVRKAPRLGTLTPYLEDTVTGTSSQRLLASTATFVDTFLGRAGIEPLRGLRTPEETLSPEENIQRKVATHVPSKMADMLFKEDGKLIQAVPKKYIGDFRRLLIDNQNRIDPITKEHGFFFKNINDVENWYQTYTGRFPTAEEVEGYFAYTRSYETERALRTLSLLRNKWRSGVESHQIKINGKWTNQFDGVIRKELPTAFEKAPVYLSVGGEDKVKVSGGWTNDISEGVKQGRYSVVELWNREDKPFHELSKVLTNRTEPRYVITDSLRTRPIDPNMQVPRRGGGHWVFPYDHYLRQANTYFDPVTKEWIYKGDTTAMPFQNVSLGRKIVQKLNEVKNLIAEGMIDDARYFTNTLGVAGLDFDKDVLPWFKGKEARFNMHEPFELVPVDKTVMSMDNRLIDRYQDKGGLQDTTRYGNMARNNQVEFTGERDAWDMHTIEDSGTANNPIFSYRPAKLADPIDVVNRSFTRISNSMWLDDYKYMAAEHWYQTYRPWLDIDKGGSPFYHFINPVWKTGAPDVVKELAMSNRKKAMDFVRMPSPLATYAHKVMAEAVGAIYDKAGPQAYNMIKPITDVPFEKNPIVALRSLTADLKIGLGSIPAFFMQLSAYVNLFAFEPLKAEAGTRAMMLHQYARFMPQHIDHLDMIASKMNLRGATGMSYWKDGHFKHLWDGLNNKTDYGRVGKEHAFQDFALSDRYMRNGYDVIKYWGSTAFREAAQTVRIASWYTSGLKWIEEHEGQLPSTRDHWAQIKDYATMLDHNMSRASNSSINTGIMSVPAQFYTYDRNMAEDMWGKRVTPLQKLRLFTFSSMMWGVPFGGLGLVGAPIGYAVNKWAINNGYTVGANTLQSIFMEGLPAWLLASATGHGDSKKGEWYDFSRFGVKGWGMLTGLFSDDSRWWTLLGAMPSTVINTALRAQPLWQDVAAILHGVSTSDPVDVPGVGTVPGGNGDWSKFNPTLEDMADVLKEWNGFSIGHRLYQTIKTGVRMSNNNTPLQTNVTAGSALIQALTGMVPADVSNISENFGILADRTAQKNALIREGAGYYNLALLSAKDNTDLANNPTYQANMRKIKILVDQAPATERAEIMKDIFNRNKPLVEVIQEKLGTTMASPDDTLRYLEQLRINQERSQTGNQ